MDWEAKADDPFDLIRKALSQLSEVSDDNRLVVVQGPPSSVALSISLS